MQSLSWSTQYNKFQLYLYIIIKAIHYITINYTHSNIENHLQVPTVGDPDVIQGLYSIIDN